MTDEKGGIRISLSREMLLVLHDLVVRMTDAPQAYGMDLAETEALDRLELLFEARGDLLFAPEHPELLAAARRTLGLLHDRRSNSPDA